MTATVLTAADTTDLKTVIEKGDEIVYVTFGEESCGEWTTAKMHLSAYELVALYLLPDVDALDAMGWTDDRVDLKGQALGNSAPKGVFFNRGGTKAIVLTGRRALMSKRLREGRKAARDAS